MTGWNIDVPQTEYYGHLPNRTDWAPGAAEGFQSVLNELAVTPIIAFDTETTGLNVSSDYPLYFSLAWGNRRATLHADLLQYFPGLFADPSKWWVMANAKYDMHMAYMAKRGGVPMGTKIRGKAVDTCVMHSLLYEDKPHGLKYMCQHIGGWSWGDFQDQFGRITKANPPSAIIFRAEQEDFPRLVEYAANDAWGTLLVYNKLREQLERAGTHSLFRSKPPYIETLWDLFYKVEVPYTSALWQMERHGIKVNRSTLEQARPDAERHIDTMERQANALYVKDMGMAINANVNLNSADQLRSWLIDTRGLEPLTMTKGGKTGNRKASVDAKFLQHHADHGDEACKLILEHRSYSKLLGTYIIGLSNLLDDNGRIHSRFNQDVARTGRLSSSDPNLQNIPRPENDHWNLRNAFIPEDGYDIICFDYAQLEMRLLAAAALERPMIDMIHSGKDIHIGNAEIVFGLPYDDIKVAKKKEKKDLTSYDRECLAARAAVKNIGFGILYGMGAPKMAHDLGITEAEATSKIDQFLNTYPAVRRFTEEAVDETERTGYAFTVLGRRRNVPEIMSRSPRERSRGERLAVNTQIQGSAADVVKMAQILYDQLGYERDFDCKMILQVHDELVFECLKENTPVMCEEIKELMEHPFSQDLAVHLLAEGGAGSSWGAVK
jgi:DNA polymerase-1